MRKLILFPIFALLLSPQSSAALENGMPADLVIGQPNFDVGAVNQGAAAGANTLNLPRGVFSNGKVLIVGDTANNRVLIWNQIPKVNGVSADVVIGQPDFFQTAANNGGRSAATLNAPRGIFYDGRRLFIADDNNHRILIYNSLPKVNGAPADVAIGQLLFTTAATGVSRQNFNAPRGVVSDGKRLVVSDTNNGRILVFNSIPSQNFAPADFVIGQPDFTSNLRGLSQFKINGERGVAIAGEAILVADQANRRVLIFNSFPTQNQPPADVVVGESDFQSATVATSRTHTLRPYSVATDGSKLFISDENANRVLIFKSVPKQNGLPAEFVLGQDNLTTGGAGTTRTTMNGPSEISFDGIRLYVADRVNNRILIFNLAVTSSIDLGPQFTQGKAVVGKVFWDFDGDGRQDA